MSNPTPVIFCAHASIYSCIVLRQLLTDKQINVLAVVESSRIKRVNSTAAKDIMSILACSGFYYAIYLAWVTSVYNLLGGLSGLPTLRRQCREQGIPILTSDNINTAEGLAFIRSQLAAAIETDVETIDETNVETIDRTSNEKFEDTSIDTIVVTAMFNQKLSSELLAIDKLSCINLHPGKLPDYRGVDPVLMTLRDKQASCEISLHQTTAEFDCGNIIASESIAANHSQSLFWHQYQLFQLGAVMLCQWLADNADSDLREAINKAQPQKGQGQYYSWPTRSDIKSLGRLITWRDIKNIFSDR